MSASKSYYYGGLSVSQILCFLQCDCGTLTELGHLVSVNLTASSALQWREECASWSHLVSPMPAQHPRQAEQVSWTSSG